MWLDVFSEKKTRITTELVLEREKKLFPWISVYIIYILWILQNKSKKCFYFENMPKKCLTCIDKSVPDIFLKTVAMRTKCSDSKIYCHLHASLHLPKYLIRIYKNMFIMSVKENGNDS